MKLNEQVAFAKELNGQFGPKETATYLWSRFVNRNRTKVILIALSEPKPIPKAVEASKDHVFRFATVEEVLELQKDPSMEINDDNIDQLRRGMTRCLLQLDGDVLAGYTWVWTSKLALIVDGYHINLPDDTVYNYKGYTPQAYRGFGFQAIRHLKVLELMADQGVTRLFGYVDHLNNKSLHGTAKSGYVRVGELIISHKGGAVTANLTVTEDFWPGVARTI